MIMPGDENDLKLSTNKINHHRKNNWLHVAIVGGMAASLGTAVVTGVKKSTTAHVVSALCFVATAMLHLFMHQRQLSYRVKP
jgi:uncharacterized membrane protein YphA (DoxX/SURF4 family)